MPGKSQSSKQASTKENSPPEFTIFSRVAAIPMVSSSFQTIDGALLNNAYTCSPYSAAKGISNAAYKLSEPLQARLAPLITHADGIANYAVDVVEQKYPYPFKAKPEEVASLVRESRQSASDYAHRTIDEKVKTPAYTVAQGIDERLTPIVDYFQVAVMRIHNSESGPSTPPDAKYQYQRALALSKTLKDDIYLYSNDQLKQIQRQSVLVQRATDTAHAITNLASSSITQAQTRIHALSDNMLCELHKLQSTTASISASLQESVHNSASQLQSQIPPQLQETYHELSNNLSASAAELREIIMKKDMPLQEKVGCVGHEVRERIAPLLEAVRKGIAELLARGKSEAREVQQNGVNATHEHHPNSD
ncbi:hypothetical protein BDZ94DRAFT_1267751 [Collybia nuda]|uniref:Lipid droplet-associated perilipin protein n=1 Tax=Collybia nuda TaxID=64659 RepID=A0A9P5Y1J2_9AGAR|nr:hypothetical protein BDZ94DRAFT_1267751 [Collybia nuda]